MRISEALRDVSHLGLDTAPIIYFVENHPVNAEKVDAILQLASTLPLEFFTSVITITESLMKPIQAGNGFLVSAYLALLREADSLTTVSITPEIAESAAFFRARYNLRTPDALHVATAMQSGCQAFLTNDVQLKRVAELRILLIDELDA